MVIIPIGLSVGFLLAWLVVYILKWVLTYYIYGIT